MSDARGEEDERSALPRLIRRSYKTQTFIRKNDMHAFVSLGEVFLEIKDRLINIRPSLQVTYGFQTRNILENALSLFDKNMFK